MLYIHRHIICMEPYYLIAKALCTVWSAGAHPGTRQPESRYAISASPEPERQGPGFV